MTTTNATVRRNQELVLGKGALGNMVVPGVRTVELAAAASADVVDFKLRIPTDARIDFSSSIVHDDLATSGAPTLDIGLFAVNSNITSDDDALTAGLTLATGLTWATRVPVVADHANAGKKVWEILGLSSDPGGFVDVKGTVRDAATTATGTITLDLKYYLD